MNSSVTLPNLITVMRLVLVPIVVWLITESRLDLAFWLFVIAGASDGVDGFIARHWNLRSELGAHLDPIADKSLLVSIYVTLSIVGVLPRWLVILVVSRDLLIVGAIILSWVMGRPVPMKPLLVSKLNTAAQILLAAVVLGDAAFVVNLAPTIPILIVVVAALTALSGAAYMVEWLKIMSAEPGGRDGPAAGGPAT